MERVGTETAESKQTLTLYPNRAFVKPNEERLKHMKTFALVQACATITTALRSSARDLLLKRLIAMVLFRLHEKATDAGFCGHQKMKPSGRQGGRTLTVLS
jgi:hypothetical protein